MLKVSESVIKLIKCYDDKLYIQWNNEDKCFEIWRNMPWGNRLITPVVESIYDPTKDNIYTTVDNRILGWLYSADSCRANRHWKWENLNRFNKKREERRKAYHRANKNTAKDTYNIISHDLLHVDSSLGDSDDWVKPDYKGGRRRTYARTAGNAKKYFGDKDAKN